MKNNDPFVSVIINCHNSELFLEEAINSVLNQTYKNIEIIVYDNSSTDKTKLIIDGFLCDNRIKYFYSELFLPLGEARNRAIAEANGEFIAFLDSDDLWENNKLDLQIKEFLSWREVGIVLSNFVKINMNSGKEDIYDTKHRNRCMEFEQFVCNYDFCWSSCVIRKDAINELSYLFRPDFVYAEEFELLIRIAYKWKAMYLSNPLTKYRIHNSNSTYLARDKIGKEYRMSLDSLKSVCNEFDKKYPRIVKRINYLADFSDAKSCIVKKDYIKIKTLVKPYFLYNYRAAVFFLVSLFPKKISELIFNAIYKNRMRI